MKRNAVRVAVILVMFLSATHALPNEARVVEANDREIVIELATENYAIERVVRGGESFFRVSAPGYGLTSEEGRPRLPLEGALLGVPFGSDVSFEVVSVESENLGPRRVEPAPRESIVREDEFAVPVQDYEPDAEFYRGRGTFPANVASLGFDSVMRHQRVVRIVFHPFQYSAATGELTLHKRIVVRVRLGGDARAEGMRPVVAREPHWEAVLAGTILNYDQARKWRARRESRYSAPKGVFRQDHESYRIEVNETGVHRLDFSDLAAEGLAGVLDVDTVAVFQRSFDGEEDPPFVETALPIVVVDADEDGFFDDSDYLLFHALSFRDQHVDQGYEHRYDTGNVYWFGWGDGLAARMGTRSAWLGATGLTPAASFRDTLRFEEDVYFDATPVSDLVSFYSWTDYVRNDDEYELPFSLPDIDPAEATILTARYQGATSGTHRIDFSVENGNSQDNYLGYFQFTGESHTMDEDVYTSGAVPASYFTDGDNILKTVGSLGTYNSGANLDWFTWSYLREYEARVGRLRFTNAGLTGTNQFDVGGFAGESIMAFDVTDPWAPVALLLQDENIEPDDGTYRLIIQDVVGDFTRYEAAEATTFLAPSSVDRREPANLHDREADMIVVSYDSFASAVEPLIARRESEGFLVAHALLSEVYDEFGGGLPGPQPLRNYFMYAFDEWERQPQFVLLVGDASEDVKRITSTSSPNYMPTYLFLGRDDKIQASDHLYISGDAPTYIPQMFIGRLPAGGSAQLQNFVSKIGIYENYSTADGWRNNNLLIADDLWSYVSLTAPYSKKTYESDFTEVSVEVADVTASSPAGIDTTLFLLRRYTDPYHGSTTEGDIGYAFQTAQWVRDGGARGDLIEQINQGAALVNFEGHGNRTQLTHEQLLLATSTSSNDMPLLANDNRPFIFLGFSCELARFHDHREATTIDCVMEQMLQRTGGAGAVATYACSGVAFLTPNALLHEKIYEAFFTDPTPEGPASSYSWPRWSLGGTLAKGQLKYLTDMGAQQYPPTYVLLGDPLTHVEMSPPSIRVTVDGEAHVSGDFLEASEELVTIVADIIDEVEMDPADITLKETDVGAIDPGDYALESLSDTLGEWSRWYRLTYTAPVRDWSYDIRLEATDANGASTTFTLHVAEGQNVLIRDVANHPNPFGDETNIIYLLNQGGAEVTIRIFTVGGRLIRVIDDAPGELNYNQVLWDGRDQDRDEVASGIYLYVIDVEGSDGSTTTTDVGRMVKIGGYDPDEGGGSRR